MCTIVDSIFSACWYPAELIRSASTNKLEKFWNIVVQCCTTPISGCWYFFKRISQGIHINKSIGTQTAYGSLMCECNGTQFWMIWTGNWISVQPPKSFFFLFTFEKNKCFSWISFLKGRNVIYRTSASVLTHDWISFYVGQNGIVVDTSKGMNLIIGEEM